MDKFKILLHVVIGGVIVVLLLLITCNYLVCNNAKGKLYTEVNDVPDYEVGLLLGTTPQTRIGHRPNQFFKFRIDATEALYKAGKVKTILISGDENSLDGINEVECMRDSLIARGVPSDVIILDGKGFRTLDAVVRATKVYDKHNYIVISQKFHNERAIYLAEHLGLEVENLSGFNAADATSNMAIMTYVREYFARVKVFVDIVTGKEPISIEKSDSDQSASMDDYDWTPEEFKTEHPDEWTVVKPAINVQQRDGDIDFNEIDILIKDYLVKKKITLPVDKSSQIKTIEKICISQFDISGYDESNMGMHIADGTRRLFEMYINWLYEKEATRTNNDKMLVDLEMEHIKFKCLNDALYDVCDSVASCMSGSGGWVASSQIHDLSIGFCKYMNQAILGETIEKKREMDVPLNLFDEECKALIDNYKPYEDYQPQDPSLIVNRYKIAFHDWYTYRKVVASKFKDSTFKKAYESITYRYARTHFLHLKNRYSDIGLMSNDMVESCLDDDCSNNELLKFNYEKKWNDLFGDL